MRQIWFLLFIGIMSSCANTLWFKPYTFTYKFDGKYTGLDTLINIDGYYYPVTLDTSGQQTMFFRDGTYYTSWYTNNKRMLIDKSNQDSRMCNWGVYKVVGDTIKSQSIRNVGGTSASVFETWYLIKSPKKIATIYKKDLAINHLWEEENNLNYEFYPYQNRLDSTNYLKKKSWFWDKKAKKAMKKQRKVQNKK